MWPPQHGSLRFLTWQLKAPRRPRQTLQSFVRPGFGSLTMSFPPHPGDKHVTKTSPGLGEGLRLASQGDK